MSISPLCCWIMMTPPHLCRVLGWVPAMSLQPAFLLGAPQICQPNNVHEKFYSTCIPNSWMGSRLFYPMFVVVYWLLMLPVCFSCCNLGNSLDLVLILGERAKKKGNMLQFGRSPTPQNKTFFCQKRRRWNRNFFGDPPPFDPRDLWWSQKNNYHGDFRLDPLHPPPPPKCNMFPFFWHLSLTKILFIDMMRMMRKGILEAPRSFGSSYLNT